MALEKEGKETVKCPHCGKRVPIGYSICPYCGNDIEYVFRLKATIELSFIDTLQRIKKISTFSYVNTLSNITVSPDFAGPLINILAISLLIGFRSFILSSFPLFSILSNRVLLLLMFFFSIIITFSSFTFFSFLSNKILRVLGGEGSFNQTFSILGYSAIPLIFGFITTNIILLVLPNALNISATIFVFFIAWFSYYASVGLHFAHKVSKKLAFLIVFGQYLLLTGFLLV